MPVTGENTGNVLPVFCADFIVAFYAVVGGNDVAGLSRAGEG